MFKAIVHCGQLVFVNYYLRRCEITACGQLSFTSAGDDYHWIYADGQFIGSHNGWNTAITVTIPGNVSVIAVKIVNTGGAGGLLGNFSDGSVTDDSWKCSSITPPDQWTLSTFDDSSWPSALATKVHDEQEVTPKITNKAKWIWIGTTYYSDLSITVYCRKKLGGRLTFKTAIVTL